MEVEKVLRFISEKFERRQFSYKLVGWEMTLGMRRVFMG